MTSHSIQRSGALRASVMTLSSVLAHVHAHGSAHMPRITSCELNLIKNESADLAWLGPA